MKITIGEEGHQHKIFFWDSLNLLTRPLASLVPMFELDVQDKPFFPYLANRPENYGVKMNTLPPKEDYLYNGFMPSKRKAFDQWYAEHYNDGFYLDEALASYCMNDVDILMAALISFRTRFMQISKRDQELVGIKKAHEELDPLCESMTIASACMKHFRLNHLKYKHLTLVTDRGFDKGDAQSTIALKFLKWYSAKHQINLRHAHTPGGEKRIGPYKVDGYVAAENKVIEFNGCYVHGCSKCYPDENVILANGQSAGKKRKRDAERLNYIKERGFNVKVFLAM